MPSPLDTPIAFIFNETQKKSFRPASSITSRQRGFLRFALCGSFVFAVIVAISLFTSTSAQRIDSSLIKKTTGGVPASSFPQILAVEAVDTFSSDCSTSQSSFVLGNTICAVASGAPLPVFNFRQRRFQWVAPNGIVVQQTDIIADPQSDTFTVPTAGALAQVGTWTVRIIKNNGSTAALTRFVVKDPNNLRTDLTIGKFGPFEVTSGNNVTYSIIITNHGPDDAQSVVWTDTVPANMSFISGVQTGGPAFNCTYPTSGGTGTVTCTLASLLRDATATFTLVYEVTAGTPNGTTILNTADITSSTVELNPADNSSTASVIVTGAGGGGTDCVISCPADVHVPHAPGQAGAIVNYPAPTTTGSNCGAVSCSQASNTFFPVGNTTVICSAETGDPCTFEVVVEDTVDPTISCPSNITVAENPTGSGAAIVNYPAPTASDDSGSVTVSCDRPSGSSFPVGTTTVTCTATDMAVNVAVCSFTITVTGSTCTLSCPSNVIVDVTGSACGGIVTYPAPTATGCGNVTSTPASGTFFNVGTTTVTVTTAVGESCDFTVTVNEHVAPVVVAPAPQTVVGDASCQAAVPDFLTGLNASDNCTEAEFLVISQNPAAGTSVGFGPHTVAISVTDSSGNTKTVNTTLTVTDATPPVITLNGANPLQVECHTSFTDPGATAHDACAGNFAATASGVVNVNTPGSYTITYTASDPSGNAAAPVSRTVNVVDTTPPVITSCATPVTVSAGSSCAANVAVPNMTGGVVATDSCQSAGTLIKTQVPAAGTLVGLGTTTVTITVRDAANNSTSCSTTFTVIAPPLSAVGPAQIWLGLKNSDDVGTNFDVLAEAYRNGVLVGSGQINNVSGGSSGFNNAILRAINMTQSGTVGFCPGDVLGIKLSIRIGATGHRSGTARLWFNDSAANSRFTATVGGTTTTYYLLDAFVLGTAVGPGPKKTIDVFADRAVGGNPFKPFGTWTRTF